MQRLLLRRIPRNLRRDAVAYAALGLIIFLAVFIIVSIIAAGITVRDGTHAAAENNRIEDGQFFVFEKLTEKNLAAIDASCYVLDCRWNVHHTRQKPLKGWNVDENYEPFIRNLRAKRPGVPIVMAGYSDVYGGATDMREKCARDLYWKLRAEGWEGLYFVPGAEMYGADGEGTVDGVHPNDWGMVHLAEAYGKAVARALGLEKSGAAKVARFYFADPELVAAVLDANADSGETDTAKWMTGTGDGK